MSGKDRIILPTTSKVYINPNFNKPIVQQQPNKLHVNPNFTQYKQVPRSNRIFVNPNFMRIDSSQPMHPVKLNDVNNGSTNHSLQLVHNSHNHQRVEQISEDFNAPVSTYRYSLVRHTVNKPSEKTLPQNITHTIKINKYKSISMQCNQDVVDKPEKVSNTIKLNKYKSVSLNQIKKKTNDARIRALLSYVKPTLNETPQVHTGEIKSNKVLILNKLISKKNLLSPRNPKNIKLLRNLSLNKSYTFNKYLTRDKVKSPRAMKKNNIPCSLFRKYGKCLRASYGKCEFLHNKKHVSICRKFLKGVCHDRNCLLSHDLTSNKMPTCYFYLNGMCSKENCPYLHVKLNEKAKICIDFLKGYCEKGDTCLHRHIHMCPDFESRGFCLKKSCPYPHGNKKVKCSSQRSKKCNNVIRKRKTSEKLQAKEGTELVNHNKDASSIEAIRYYKDSSAEGETDNCEVIKPIRCKLGSLPSFIKL